MITWEYRVFQEEDGAFIIREVFYDDEGNLVGCTQDAVEPIGKSLKELAADIQAFKAALKLPVLTLADMPRPKRKKQLRDRKKNRTLEQVTADLALGARANKNRSRVRTNGKRVLAASGRKK